MTVTSPVVRYAYHPRNVLLAYAIAGGATLLANLAGLYAFHISGVAHDTSFSSIACSTHGVHFSRGLRAHERLGALPLGTRIAETQVKWSTGEDGRYGFCAAKEVKDIR